MPLPVAENSWLPAASLCWVLEFDDRGTCPLALTDVHATTAQLGVGPLLVSSRDLVDLPFTGGPRAGRNTFDREVLSRNPVAYWRCAEPTGATSVANYTTQSGLNATVVNGLQHEATGPVVGDTTGWMFLDAVAPYPYLELADDARLDIGTGSCAFLAIVNTTLSTRGVLYDKTGGTGSGGLLVDIGNAAVGRLRAGFDGVGVEWVAGDVADGVQHTILVVADRPQGMMMLYVDGLERARTSIGSKAGVNVSSSNVVRLGVAGGGASPLYGLYGRIAWYNTALTAEDAWAIHAAVEHYTQKSAERRLVSRPVVTHAVPQEGVGTTPLATLSFDVLNHDGLFDAWLDGEGRGHVVRAHLYDVATGTLTEDVFRGEIAQVTQRGPVLSGVATELPLWGLSDVIPRARVRPYATAEDYPSTQRAGAGLPRGWGIVEHLPCPNVSYDAAAGYRYAIGAGNWAVGLVSIGGVASYDDAEFTLDPRAVIDGEPATVLRLVREPSPAYAAVTVMARRLPDLRPTTRLEWDWMAGFRERLAGLPVRVGVLRGASSLTTASLCQDDVSAQIRTADTGLRVGSLLGALQFNGTSDYLEAGPCSEAYQWQTFTIEARVWCDPAQSGTIVCGPWSPFVASGDVPSYRLRWNHSSGEFELIYRTGTNTTTTHTSAGGPWAGWVTVRVSKTPTTCKFYVDGNLEATLSSGVSAITYATTVPFCTMFVLGRSISNTTPDYWKGKLGWLRMDCAAGTDREAERTHHQLMANPVEALREVIERELRQPCDDTTWRTAATTLVTVAGASYPHALRVDGAFAEDTDTQAAIAALCQFRDLHLGRNANGITCAVPIAATTAAAAFGVGGLYNNVVGEPERVQPSTAEAVRSLVIAYDLARDVTGAVGAPQQRVPFALASVGREAVTVVLPLVRAHRCADVIGEWLQKTLQARRNLYRVPVGHEGRVVRAGQVVQVTLPSFRKAALDCDVLSRGVSGPTTLLQLAPYDAARFTYGAGRTLPTPTTPVYTTFDLGRDPTIEWNNATRELRVVFETRTTHRPQMNGTAEQWDTVGGGAGSHWQAVSDDNAATYVEDSGSPVDLFRSTQSLDVPATWTTAVPDGWEIAAVRLIARAQHTGSGSGPVREVWLLHRVSGGEIVVVSKQAVTGTYANYTATVTHPSGRLFAPSDLATHEWGMSAHTSADGESVRVMSLTRTIHVRPVGDDPKGFGYVKVWWRSAATPAPVDGVDVADYAGPDRTAYTSITTPGTYYAWASCYDASGRRVRQLGPIAFTVS